MSTMIKNKASATLLFAAAIVTTHGYSFRPYPSEDVTNDNPAGNECLHWAGSVAIPGSGASTDGRPFIVESDVPVILSRMTLGISNFRGPSSIPNPIPNGMVMLVRSDCSNENVLETAIDPSDLISTRTTNNFDGNNGAVPTFTVTNFPSYIPDSNQTFLNSTIFSEKYACMANHPICRRGGGGGSGGSGGSGGVGSLEQEEEEEEGKPICENPPDEARNLRTSPHHTRSLSDEPTPTCTVNVEIVYWGCENEIYVNAPSVVLRNNEDTFSERLSMCRCQTHIAFEDALQNINPEFNVMEERTIGDTDYIYVKGGEEINPYQCYRPS